MKLQRARMFVPTAFAAVLCFGASATAQDVPMGVLFAVGDIAKCAVASDKLKSGEAIAKVVANEIARAREETKQPDLPVGVLVLGDAAYDHGTPDDFKCFDKHWGSLRRVMFPVPGNHEYDKKLPNGKASSSGTRHAGPFFDYFSDDVATGERFKKTLKQNGDRAGYYFVNFPENALKPWRLIGLNSNIDNGASSEQIKKLKEDLKTTKAAGVRCVLAFSHAFYYSSGRHGHGHVGSGPLSAALKPEGGMSTIFQTLHEGSASVLVAGHDHHFEQLGRARPDGEDGDKGKAAQATDGVRSFVVGTGGTQLHSLPQKDLGGGKKRLGNDYDRRWSFSEAINLDGYGILRIDLHDGFYKWQYVPEPTRPGTMVIITPLPEKRDDCNRS